MNLVSKWYSDWGWLVVSVITFAIGFGYAKYERWRGLRRDGR